MQLRRYMLAAGCCLAPLSAIAKDMPATPEGAAKLAEVFATYLGKTASSPPNLTIAPNANQYDVTFDLGAVILSYKVANLSINAAKVKVALAEQDDGTWRYSLAGLPKVSAHFTSPDGKVVDVTYEYSGVRQEAIFDPKLGWIKSGSFAAEKLAALVHEPGLDETINLGPISQELSSTFAGDEATSSGKYKLGGLDFSIAIRPAELKPADGKVPGDAAPFKVAVKSGDAAADVSMGGIKGRAALALWAFAVAHPTRAELAANESQFKTLLSTVLSNDLGLSESVSLQTIVATAPQGPFTLESAKLGFVAGVNSKTNLEEHFAGDGLTMPAGLLPPMFADLVPHNFDVGFKLSGFDAYSAGQEAIADLHLAGEGAIISDDDGKKILAKGMAPGPVVIALPASHLVAPKLDLSYEGKITIDGLKRFGAVTVRVKNFDQTVEALKAVGPLISPSAMTGLAMAKGLAKKEDDGALTWVAELAADGSMSVNGLPLGKAPMPK